MVQVHGGTLVASTLEQEGVRYLFSLGGGHINPIWEACQERAIRVIDVRHEAAAAHMAEGWALVTGEPGVCTVTAGPGVTNAVTGVATAFRANSPMVCIGGAASVRGYDTGELQDMNQIDMMKPISKWARVVFHTDRIPEYLGYAFREACTGRPGPVYLEIPLDVMRGQVDGEQVRLPRSHRSDARVGADPRLIDRAVDLLCKAERPIIVAGSGVWWSQAMNELQTFVERSGTPVVTRQAGRGTVPDDHPLSLGRAYQDTVPLADVLLVVGTQFNFTFQYGRFPAQVIQVDIAPAEIAHNRPVEVGMVGDAQVVLGQLAEAMPRLKTEGWVRSLRARLDEVADAQSAFALSDAVPIHPLRLTTEIARFVGRDATLVTDGGNTHYWAGLAFKAYEPGHILGVGQMGTLGPGIPYALAAKLARPDTQVLCLCGDGTFGLNGLEMDSAIRHNLPIVVVILNNRGWGGRWIPLGLRHYELVAQGLGGYGELVSEPQDIRPALERAFASGKPACLNVLCDPDAQRPRPRAAPAG